MQNEQKINVEQLIALETKRLSEQYGKSFLNIEELMELMGLGKDNVFTLMNENDFPIIKVGSRKVISIIAFVSWLFQNHQGGN